MTTTRNDPLGPTATLAPTIHRAALVTAALVAAAVVSLALFYAVGGPFGAVNDALNAAVGVATAGMAVLGTVAARRPRDRTAALFGVLGGAVFVLGSSLVLTDTTGWFLAGLVSAVGGGLIGLWLLLLDPRPLGLVARSSLVTVRLGRAAGAVMAFGLLALPAALVRVDDWADAPWYAGVAMLGWLGTYLLYPVWCLRTARAT